MAKYYNTYYSGNIDKKEKQGNTDIENEEEIEEEKIEGRIGDINFETKQIPVKTLLKDCIPENIKKEFNIKTNKNDIALNLEPSFQRYYVWDIKKATLLIESILLGIPLPIIYLAEEENGSMVMVDGQQRLKSVLFYIEGYFNRSSNKFRLSDRYLKTQDDNIQNKSFSELDEEYQKKILDYKFTVSIIKKDSKPDLKYEMFFRLNQGAKPLNNIEMICSQHMGKYLDFIKELAEYDNFVDSMGFRDEESSGRGRPKTKKANRKEDLEFVLEFLAVYDIDGDWTKYKNPRKFFLKQHMEKKEYKDENINEENLKQVEKVFKDTFDIIYCIFKDEAFKVRRMNKRTGELHQSNKHNQLLYTILTCLISKYIDKKDWFLEDHNASRIKKGIDDALLNFNSSYMKNKQDYVGYYNNLKKVIDNYLNADEIAKQYQTNDKDNKNIINHIPIPPNISETKENERDNNKIILETLQIFENKIVKQKFKCKTIGEFLQDKPYKKYSEDAFCNLINNNESIISSINNKRNFFVHEDTSYKIKDDVIDEWLKFLKELDTILKMM